MIGAFIFGLFVYFIMTGIVCWLLWIVAQRDTTRYDQEFIWKK